MRRISMKRSLSWAWIYLYDILSSFVLIS